MVSISSYLTGMYMQYAYTYAYMSTYIYVYTRVLAIKLCFGQRMDAGGCSGRVVGAEKFRSPKKRLFLHRGLDGRTKFLTAGKTNHSKFDLYILSGYENTLIRPSNVLKANR